MHRTYEIRLNELKNLAGDDKIKIELQKLWFIANHYMDLANKIFNENFQKYTIKEINNNWIEKKLYENEILWIAHISSSCVRLWSIDELISDIKDKDYTEKEKKKFRKYFYKIRAEGNDGSFNKTVMQKIIHCILRNSPAHKEDIIKYEGQSIAIDRLSLKDLKNHFESVMCKIQKDYYYIMNI